MKIFGLGLQCHSSSLKSLVKCNMNKHKFYTITQIRNPHTANCGYALVSALLLTNTIVYRYSSKNNFQAQVDFYSLRYDTCSMLSC